MKLIVLSFLLVLQLSCSSALSEEDLKLLNAVVANNEKLEQRINELEKTVKEQKTQLSRASRNAGDAGIAFSAILQHDMDNLGPEQVILFNDVLLNDGDAYNNVTGEFVTPVTGVYAFTFFVGQRGINQIFVHLTKNGQAIADAGSEGTTDSHDTAGGNAVILPLSSGDVVQIKHHTWGTHVEGGIPQTTFSGFLLYEMEDGPMVVG